MKCNKILFFECIPSEAGVIFEYIWVFVWAGQVLRVGMVNDGWMSSVSRRQIKTKEKRAMRRVPLIRDAESGLLPVPARVTRWWRYCMTVRVAESWALLTFRMWCGTYRSAFIALPFDKRARQDATSTHTCFFFTIPEFLFRLFSLLPRALLVPLRLPHSNYQSSPIYPFCRALIIRDITKLQFC